ncbi:hypothetical protein L596_006908 [Steinernema carpocapsae]|uniref:Uncharacterized protein n=1 Tax=Steinernema carpocapsae TaxID=34508 RepID=A0A4U5P8D1_STECR|nr:hypothetical protein L596_006908 [Steinernema carpocapsae]
MNRQTIVYCVLSFTPQLAILCRKTDTGCWMSYQKREGLSIEAHIERMEKNRTFKTDFELQMAALALNITIYVYSPNHTTSRTPPKRPNQSVFDSLHPKYPDPRSLNVPYATSRCPFRSYLWCT